MLNPDPKGLVVRCSNCSQQLRLKGAAGLVKVTCPSCKVSFVHDAGNGLLTAAWVKKLFKIVLALCLGILGITLAVVLVSLSRDKVDRENERLSSEQGLRRILERAYEWPTPPAAQTKQPGEFIQENFAKGFLIGVAIILHIFGFAYAAPQLKEQREASLGVLLLSFLMSLLVPLGGLVLAAFALSSPNNRPVAVPLILVSLFATIFLIALTVFAEWAWILRWMQ